MQPEQSTLEVQPQPITPTHPQRHFLAVFFLSFMWGIFGIDRFYLGKVWTGILKLLTLGGFGMWVIIDLAVIMSGAMRDKQGNEMLEAARYKKFAGNTTLIFGLVVGATVVLSGVSLFYILYPLVTELMQSGGLEKLIPTGGSVPGLDQLQNL
ncbi:TM2 domain-containing protein [Candidatus Saccharibacteria bacterium]|nr:TM2 domain-containing protein [Candidatus Saccharibacteria bacterium]